MPQNNANHRSYRFVIHKTPKKEANRIRRLMNHCVRLLHFKYDDSTYPLGVHGSGILCKYKTQLFFIATLHSFKIADALTSRYSDELESLMIRLNNTKDEKRCIKFKYVSIPKFSSSDEKYNELKDIIIYECDMSDPLIRKLKNKDFCVLEPNLELLSPGGLCFLCGFPHPKTDYETFTITSTLKNWPCTLRNYNNQNHTFCLEIKTDDQTSMNGMSGGGVFVFDKTRKRTVLCGMLQQGCINAKLAHCISSGCIIQYLEEIALTNIQD